MDWTKGYSAHWRVYEVDSKTWADGGLLSGATSVTINRDGAGEAPLMESGAVSLDTDISEDFKERYLRIAMYAEQDDGATRVDVATLLFASTTGNIDKGFDAVELTGRSVLYPASTKVLLTGTYAPKGVDGAQWCASMLRDAIQAPVEVFGSFTLETNTVFDGGTTYLACVWQILDAGGFVIQIAGNGTVQIMPRPADPSIVLDAVGAQLLHPGMPYTMDWSKVPNRYTAIEGSNVATVVNDDSGSPVSTSSRGYVVDVLDTKPVRVNGESLEQYAARRLEELSTVPDERTYVREYYPGVYPFSIARGNLSGMNLDGDLRIVTQALTCDKGITVQEKAQREVKLWQR